MENGIVTAISDHDGECEHHLVSPGLVDLQVNGWDTIDCAVAESDELRSTEQVLARKGTTSWLATLITDDMTVMTDRIDRLSRHVWEPPGIVGIHLEGPFLGAAPGAHRKDRIVNADPEWITNLPTSVRLMTIGAEQPLTTSVVPLMTNKGIAVSIGHTRASRAEFDAAVDAGATMVTHLFNAMSGVHHRDHGIALSALTNSRVVAGLIADMHHVSPDAVRLAFAAKPTGIALVSDSIAWSSKWATRNAVSITDGVARLPDGTLAGSCTSLGECVRLAVEVAGVDLEAALRAATSTPARVLGRSDIGRIAVGEPSDIVAFDSDLHVTRTWLRLVSSRGNPTDN